jgi:hypothetical protein
MTMLHLNHFVTEENKLIEKITKLKKKLSTA